MAQNTWLFQVNPSAKWFYDWEVGAARDRRAMTHVLEVYVLFERADATATQRERHGDEEQSDDSLEVVALATSPPFTLISFRRAASRRGSGDDAAVAPPASQQLPLHPYHQQQQHQPPQQEHQSQRPQEQRRESWEQMRERWERPVLVDSVRKPQELLRTVAIASSALSAVNAHAPVGYNNNDKDNDDDGMAVPPAMAAAKTIAAVLSCLDQVSATSLLLPLADVVREAMHQSLCAHVGSNPSSPLASAIARDLGHLERVLWHVTGGGAHEDTRDAHDATRSFGASHRHTQQQQIHDDNNSGGDAWSLHASSTTASSAVEVSLKLALWLLFDRDNQQQMETFLQRSARVLLDRTALVQSYEAWVEWLHERMDEFISAAAVSTQWTLATALPLDTVSSAPAPVSKWTLSRLAAHMLEHVEHERQRDGRRDGGEPSQLRRLAAASDSACLAAGREVFVAHVRELFICASGSARASRRRAARQSNAQPSALMQSSLVRVRGESQHTVQQQQQLQQQQRIGMHPRPRLPSLLSPLPSVPLSSTSSLLSGVWLCQLESVRVERADGSIRACDPSAPQSESSTGLSLLWFWRQLGCVRLEVSTQSTDNGDNDEAHTHAAALELCITSVFNPSADCTATASLKHRQVSRKRESLGLGLGLGLHVHRGIGATEQGGTDTDRRDAAARCTRLTLDSQHRWFRSLPGGESTLGSRMGGQSLGDYVGSAAVASPSAISHHDASGASVDIDVVCYTWPSASPLAHPVLSTSPPLPPESSECAHRWHWQISVVGGDVDATNSASASTQSPPRLLVRVTVARSECPVVSHAASPSSASVSSTSSFVAPRGDLSAVPLSRKLTLVERWVSVCAYEWQYSKIG